MKQENLKQCSRCKLCKAKDQFTKVTKAKDGLNLWCKVCTRQNSLTGYAKNPTRRRMQTKEYQRTERGRKVAERSAERWKENNPKKYICHMIMKTAKKYGVVEVKPCEVCGEKNVHAHHHDYDRPFDVSWLCALHHKGEHAHNERVGEERYYKEEKVKKEDMCYCGLPKNYHHDNSAELTKPKEHKSDCCGAKFKVISGDEGTNHWECEKCGKPCDDTYYERPKEPTEDWEKEFDEKIRPIIYSLGDLSRMPNKGEILHDEVNRVKQYMKSLIEAERERIVGIIKEEEERWKNCSVGDYMAGAGQALSNLLSKINEK